MIRKGIGPRPIENPATKAKLAITQINRQEYTMPSPRNRLETPILEILHNNKGFRPCRSMKCAEGSVIKRLTREIMSEIRAEEDGRIVDKIDVE
jgi:hypothetical protein